MHTPTQLKAILNYLYLNATRGSLEDHTSWYYRSIGKEGYETRANRPALESIYFITEVLDIAKNGIYQMSLDGVRYKQTYMSGAEVVRYILKNCLVNMSDKWEGFTNHKTGEAVTLRFVAFDDPAIWITTGGKK